MSEVIPLPAFSDNYIWTIVPETGAVTVVDPGQAAPVLAWLRAHGRTLGTLLLTHHHHDHIGGVPELLSQYPDCRVYAPRDTRIPGDFIRVGDGDDIEVSGMGGIVVLSCDGHTVPHIAYLWGDRLFVGDTLFAAGCGRLFEGSPEQMHASLQKINALPGNTRIHCAHEYTLDNLRFALAVEPDNFELKSRWQRDHARRKRGEPTLPSLLSEERQTNPFLRADQTAPMRAAGQRLGRVARDAVEVFATLRSWKDGFRG